MKRYRGTLSLVAVCAATLMLVPVRAQQDGRAIADGVAPDRANGGQDAVRFHRHQGKNIPNNYIVVLDQDPVGRGAANSAGGRPTRIR